MASNGSKTNRSNRDKARAAFMKTHKVERTTGRCAICYREVTIENEVKKTKFAHRCFAQ